MELYVQFNDIMTRGGPVMWVIFVTAWLAIVLLIERALQIQLWLMRATADRKALNADHGYNPPAKSMRGTSPVATLLKRLHWDDIHSRDDLSQQMHIHLAEIMPKIEGKLPTIAVLGTLLPMLGLLGTVVGMIEVFEVIALHGTGNPQEMANGISQALLTTASGLIIAIPVIFFHHLLVQRVHFLLAVTEESLLVVYNRPLPNTLTKEASTDE
jgi:biopolymer transport protein ExbB